MRVQLTWEDINTGQVRSPTLETPIAFGRDFAKMPTAMKGKSISRMVLNSEEVDEFHAILADVKGQLMISDRQEGSVTIINGKAAQAKAIQPVEDGDRITIGPFEITVTILGTDTSVAEALDQLGDPFASEEANTPISQLSTNPAATALTGTSAAPASPVEEAVAGGMTGGVAGASGSAMAAGLAGGMAMGIAGGSLSSAGSRASGPAFGSDGLCQSKVGFLFKRRCNRPTTEGCPDCKNGTLDPNRDLYEDDYAYYPGYGRYGRGMWGHDYYYNRNRYYYDPHRRNVDFNESDAASFEDEGDQDYEMDLDAS